MYDAMATLQSIDTRLERIGDALERLDSTLFAIAVVALVSVQAKTDEIRDAIPVVQGLRGEA